LGLELNSEEVLRAKSEIFEVHDCDFFEFDYNKGAYDTIALFQVLEHIKDISSFFEHARELLKSKGKLIISVPNNNPYLYVFDKYHTLNLPPHHMGLWTGRSLKKAGASFGFSVKDLQFEPISQQELGYILNLSLVNDFSFSNLKFLFLKGIRKFFPKKLFHFVSSLYRKYLVNGRNILIVLEKND
jgi:SAM-dependent methyltransferase